MNENAKNAEESIKHDQVMRGLGRVIEKIERIEHISSFLLRELFGDENPIQSKDECEKITGKINIYIDLINAADSRLSSLRKELQTVAHEFGFDNDKKMPMTKNN